MTQTLNEYAATLEAPIEQLEGLAAAPIEQPEQSTGIDLSGLWTKLKTPTGPGPVEDYQQHALNPKGSLAMARILRGATGFLGGLNFAVVDIVLGLLEFKKERSA